MSLVPRLHHHDVMNCGVYVRFLTIHRVMLVPLRQCSALQSPAVACSRMVRA